MVIVNHKFDNKIKELFKSLDVNTKKLERYSNFILNEYKITRKIWVYDLKIKMIECDTSGYYFQENLMEIGSKTTKRALDKKRRWFLGSYFHELCHFAQDNLDKVNSKRLDYTDEDAQKCNDRYYNNPMERQAREWEEKYVTAYVNLFH
tara:strand:+ start:851 stop:1297 length:447 start_codon:yes stop_codon:yes gene_type:complete